MAEFGERSGLAVRLTDETYNIRMRGAQERQAQALQEHKAAMVADDMKFNTPMNAYDRALAQKEGQAGAMKLGNFVASNPGWETNVQARTMYNQLKDSITKGENYTIGVLSDKAYKDWQEDMAKNPDKLDPEDYAETNAQWQEYQKTGMYNGKRQPFMYIAPTPFNGQQIIMDNAVKLQGRERELTSKDYQGSIGVGATIKDVTQDRAYANALGLLKDNKVNRGFTKEWNNISPEEKEIYKGGMVQWLALRIQNETGRDINTGTHYKPDSDGGKKTDMFGFPEGATSPYWEHIGKQPNNWSGSSPYIGTLMDINYNENTGKGEYVTNDGSVNIPFIDANGKPSIKKFFVPGMQKLPYDATTPGGVKKINGVLYGTARFSMPINNAMGLEGTNKIVEGTTEGSAEGELDTEEFTTLPQYKGIFDVEIDPKTFKPTGNVLVTTLVPISPTPAKIQKYNALVAGQKYAQDIQQPTMNKIEHNKNIGKIITNKQTGKQFMIVEGGYQPLN